MQALSDVSLRRWTLSEQGHHDAVIGKLSPHSIITTSRMTSGDESK